MSGGNEIVLWLLLTVASATDLIWGKIYNHLTLTFILAGVCFRVVSDGPHAALESLAAIAVGFILLFPLYLLKAFAAGDVKLLMAVGAWSNIALVLNIGIASILIGGLIGLILLVGKKGFFGSLKSVASQFRSKNSSKRSPTTRMPYAPAFLCAFLLIRIMEMKGWSL